MSSNTSPRQVGLCLLKISAFIRQHLNWIGPAVIMTFIPHVCDASKVSNYCAVASRASLDSLAGLLRQGLMLLERYIAESSEDFKQGFVSATVTSDTSGMRQTSHLCLLLSHTQSFNLSGLLSLF